MLVIIMNSTKILFLKMLRGDIKRNAYEKAGLSPDLNHDDQGLLTGQTIKKSEIESFSSYKLMNDDERAIVSSILDEIKSKDGDSKGRTLVKHIDSLVPTSEESLSVDFKDAA